MRQREATLTEEKKDAGIRGREEGSGKARKKK